MIEKIGAAEKTTTYTYDAWGNPVSSSNSATGSNSSATTTPAAPDIGQLNPLRYRRYVYDQETQLYYLQSRYYNPTTGRFLNADDYPTTGQGFTGNNMFAYCGNNPISRVDESGEFWISALVGAAVNVATTYIAAKVTGQEYSWIDAGVAALSGAANAIPVVGPLVSGAITGAYTGYMATQNGASVGEVVLCGTVAAVCTTASIGNLANFQGPALDLVTNAAVDLVFGTGYNSMAAATYTAVTKNAQGRKNTSKSKRTASGLTSVSARKSIYYRPVVPRAKNRSASSSFWRRR